MRLDNSAPRSLAGLAYAFYVRNARRDAIVRINPVPTPNTQMPATRTNSANGLVPVTGTIATGSATSWTANGRASPARSAAGAGRGGSRAAGLPSAAGADARRGATGSGCVASVAARRPGRRGTVPATGVGPAVVDGVPWSPVRGSLPG